VVIVETGLLILPEPDTLESMDNVALALSYHGNHVEAEGMHRQALIRREGEGTREGASGHAVEHEQHGVGATLITMRPRGCV
jgi:hypothetical protein